MTMNFSCSAQVTPTREAGASLEQTVRTAISQASADIMLGMIIGKSKEEALRLGKLFLRMIQGEADDEEIEQLEEASALKDIAHMPARVKCAVLGWHTLEEALKKL